MCRDVTYWNLSPVDAKIIMIYFHNGLIQVRFSFDAYCIAAQICYTVQHILLQYYRAEVFCLFLLSYSISYIVDIVRVLCYSYIYIYIYTFAPFVSNLTSLCFGNLLLHL